MEDKGKEKVIARCQGKSEHQDGRGDRHTNATEKSLIMFLGQMVCIMMPRVGGVVG